MKKFMIMTKRGQYHIEAQTRRHAVAILVARLRLDEQQAVQVINWVIVEED